MLLAQSIEKVPFDLRSYNILLYSTHFTEVTKLKTALKSIGEQHLLGKFVFGNPVTDFAPQGIANTSIINNMNPSSRSEAVDGDELADMGILEANQASQALFKVMTIIAEEINGSVNNISPLLAKFDEVTRDPALGKSREAQEVAEQISAELEKSSERIEKHSSEIEENIRIPFQVFLQFLTLLDAEDDREQFNKYRRMFSEISENVPLGLKGLKSYRNSVAQIGLRSGIMGPASRRNIQAIEKISGALSRFKHSFHERFR